MKKWELDILNGSKRKTTPIQANDLAPHLKDRTLLYGYMCDRRTFHVYMKDFKIHIVTYRVVNGQPVDMQEIHVKDNWDYLPDKRAYPERCDYHFCRLLKVGVGMDIPFTTFNDKVEKSDFYGFTLEDQAEK